MSAMLSAIALKPSFLGNVMPCAACAVLSLRSTLAHFLGKALRFTRGIGYLAHLQHIRLPSGDPILIKRSYAVS